MEKKNYTLYILAYLVTIAFFIVCTVLLFVDLKPSSEKVVFMLLGTLGSGFTTVLAYFFGSSKSSADKTAIIAQLPALPPPAPTAPLASTEASKQ